MGQAQLEGGQVHARLPATEKGGENYLMWRPPSNSCLEPRAFTKEFWGHLSEQGVSQGTGL